LGNVSTVKRDAPAASSSRPIAAFSGSNVVTETATDYPAADQCWKEWDAYSQWQTDCPMTTIESVYTHTATYAYTEYKTYKLCDGHTRAVVTDDWRTSTTTESAKIMPFSVTIPATTETLEFPPSGVPIETVTTTASEGTYTVTSCAETTPAPRCTIDGKNCKALFSAWTAGGFSRSRPPCNFVETAKACDACLIYVPTVKLLYFPVSMTGGYCGDDCKIS
jgi:hypothetical protein